MGDYGLTIKTKATIQRHWEVVLSGFQTFLINTLRRWHVASISLAVPAVVLILPRTVEGTVSRQLASFHVFVGIVAFGELLELAILYERRDGYQNAQRIVCYVIKVTLCVVFHEELMMRIIRAIPQTAAPWDP